jgi:formylglycine-generating enzyme required for sulfatase activity
LKTNLHSEEMKKTISEFEQHLRTNGNGVGLFYFSGHGIQIEKSNYLIPILPINTPCTSKQFKSMAVNATEVLKLMENASTRINIIILDACRNDLSRGYNAGFTQIGFAPMTVSQPKQPLTFDKGIGGIINKDAPHGNIISLATAPGKKASDGSGNNGLYTEYLLQALKMPGLTIEDVFKQTATEVAKASKYQQISWTESSLLGEDFCLSSCQNNDNNNDEKFKLQQQIAQLEQQLAQQTLQPQIVSSEPPQLSDRVWKTDKVFQDRLHDGNLGPEMVMIPAGRFRMGDIQGIGDSDEKPVHWVSVNDFAIGRYEVTVGEFRQFVESTEYKTDAEKGKGCYTRKEGAWGKVKDANWHTPFFSQEENYPVVCVSWNDAMAYTHWLSEQTRKPYTLPSEAQWEYAARAGTESNYWWGNNMKYNQANCWQTSKWHNGISPVGSFSPNSFKLSDILGNVWEWVADPWHKNYGGAPLDNRIWEEKGNSSYQLVRGGGWTSRPEVCRVSNRLKHLSKVSHIKGGFRCGYSME